MNIQGERHPIQNLLDEVDEIIFGIPVPDGYGGNAIHPLELDDEVKHHIRDMIRSAYATGRMIKGPKDA